jgi:hypothetical protein
MSRPKEAVPWEEAMPTAHIYVRVSDENGRSGDNSYSADD